MRSLPLSPQLAAAELLRRRRGRESLLGFANAIEIPGKPASDDPDEWLFRPVEQGVAAHHRLIMEAIERTAKRRHGRLFLFLPPGSAKSTYASVVAPTYLMGKQRDMRVILASHGLDLARRHGRRARQIARSSAYSALFGAGIHPGTSAADEWALTNGSEYLAFGVLSGIAGSRAHGLFIDDPLRGREQADSSTIRDKLWQAYTDDLLTRMIPGGFIVCIMTRWHEDDLAGRLLPKGYAGQSGLMRCQDGMDWEVLCLPAQCERDDDPLGRKPGEMLWPEWFDASHWAPHRANSRGWASLFQQRPRPDEGGIFKDAWFRTRYRVIHSGATRVVHSWDTASKPSEISAYAACTVWRSGDYVREHYLADVLRERMDYPTLKRTVINMAVRDKPAAVLIEDKSTGQSLIQELRRDTSLPVVAIEPQGDKIFRAQDVTPMCESGLVLLPEVAPWLIDFEGEFFAFPLSTYADQVDSVSQYLQWARHWTGVIDSAGAGVAREFASRALPPVYADGIVPHGGAEYWAGQESMEGFVS